MASMLEDVVGPQLLDLRREAIWSWSSTLDAWAASEENLGGHDTERLERLVHVAWNACVQALRGWDSRFALQAVRSVPPKVVQVATQLYGDTGSVAMVIRLMTAAAVAGDVQWPRIKEGKITGLGLTAAQLTDVTARLPEILGRSIGAASLTYFAQGWYRWAGKGKKIVAPPNRTQLDDLENIKRWDGEGILVVNAVDMGTEPSIDEAVELYETRKKRFVERGYRSGLLIFNGDAPTGADDLVWFAAMRTEDNQVPVYVPGLDWTFPNPAWYPLADLDLRGWMAQLRPFDDVLRERLGLTCDELYAGLRALGLVVARQTQCSYLEIREESNRSVLVLNSPATTEALRDAVKQLASVLIRGTLRSSVKDFQEAIRGELETIGWPEPEKLARTFLERLTGVPEPISLPRPLLFYVIDPMTCVLDLTVWHDFTEACLALATSGQGVVANRRSSLFEKQVRSRLIEELRLDVSELPWTANRDVWDGEVNRGDVDFCFSRGGILYNLDMKSWQRSSDYHVGHYHTIKNRLDELQDRMAQLVRRGDALQRQLEQQGASFLRRLDYLVVASPEYIALDRQSLWYGRQPRVATVKELVEWVQQSTTSPVAVIVP